MKIETIKTVEKYNASFPQFSIKYIIQKEKATFSKVKSEEHLK